jgi:hypothetical protein
MTGTSGTAQPALNFKKFSCLHGLVEWCPTAFKLGINNQKPMFVPDSELASIGRVGTYLL